MNRSLRVAKVIVKFATANENENIKKTMCLLNKVLANASNEALLKAYNAIHEEYRRRFCEKFGYTDSSWLNGEVGTVLSVDSGELFAMWEIVENLNNESK